MGPSGTEVATATSVSDRASRQASRASEEAVELQARPEEAERNQQGSVNRPFSRLVRILSCCLSSYEIIFLGELCWVLFSGKPCGGTEQCTPDFAVFLLKIGDVLDYRDVVLASLWVALCRDGDTSTEI